MKVVLVLVLVLSVCSSGFAAQFRGRLPDPAHPGKCVYGGLVLSEGESRKLNGTCELLQCDNNSEVVLYTCGLMVPPDGCRLGDYVNVDAPYEVCCKRHILC